MIPALKNAEFVRYGVMHKNTYINSPDLLDKNFAMVDNQNIYFAGQISGVEGYVESIASGLVAGLSIVNKLRANHSWIFLHKPSLAHLHNIFQAQMANTFNL